MSKFLATRSGRADFEMAEKSMCQRSTICAAVLPHFSASAVIA
ncbi:hypothetical protein [Rhizobium leguminosarum]|nr:hypothetical protein [Rhizobium leguminosarum]